MDIIVDIIVENWILVNRIHPASLLRLPVGEPEDYWKLVPLRREPVFRDVPLRHCNGNVVINELAIVRMHDRSTPVTLKMLVDTNFAKRPGKEAMALDSDWEAPTKLRAAQAAFFSYQAVLRALWPMDPTPETLGQILVKADWGGQHRTDAARANLVELLFNRVMIENASRAVKKTTPADYRRIKEIWDDLLELQPKGGASNSPAIDGPLISNRNARGGRQGPARGGRSGYDGKVTPRVGSTFVCHAYNEPAGCKREKQGQGCKNAGGQLFAHNCSQKKADGDFCLGAHPKFNHK